MSKNKTSYSTSGTLVDGLTGCAKGTQCEIYVDTELMSFKQAYVKDSSTYYLKTSQISNIGIISEDEITEKNRNVVGRGIIGGLVFGSIGAIVGGMSGVQTKKKKETTYYLVINYFPAESSSISVITFQVSPLFTRALVEYVQSRISLQEPKSINL